MSSPFAFSNVPKEWRKVCQPMFLVMPALRATGLREAPRPRPYVSKDR
jgi:hypothetical protein